MRAHVIEGGKVVNTIEVESLDFMPNLVSAEAGAIGDIYDGVTFTTPVHTPTRDELKAARQSAVDAILVTTSNGNVFNGDEVSQTRMARAVIAMNAQPQSPVPTINWTLANNQTVTITAAELTEALSLAGAAQSALWII